MSIFFCDQKKQAVPPNGHNENTLPTMEVDTYSICTYTVDYGAVGGPAGLNIGVNLFVIAVLYVPFGPPSNKLSFKDTCLEDKSSTGMSAWFLSALVQLLCSQAITEVAMDFNEYRLSEINKEAEESTDCKDNGQE